MKVGLVFSTCRRRAKKSLEKNTSVGCFVRFFVYLLFLLFGRRSLRGCVPSVLTTQLITAKNPSISPRLVVFRPRGDTINLVEPELICRMHTHFFPTHIKYTCTHVPVYYVPAYVYWSVIEN